MTSIIPSPKCMGKNTALATFAAMVFGGAVGVLFSMAQPVVTMSDLHELDGIAVEGGTLDIVVDSTRNRMCPVDIDRWLERPDPLKAGRTQYVYLGVPRIPPVGVGRASYRVTIALPANIQPGRWFYHAQARNSCGILPMWLSAAERDSGRVPVEVQVPVPATAPLIISPPAANALQGTGR